MIATAQNTMRMLLMLILAPWAAAGLSNPNDFCTGNPCNITSAKTADAGIILDFGTRAVVLSEILTIGNIPVSGLVGTLTIRAGSFAIIGNGQIKGNGGSNPAGAITIETTGNIQVAGTRATGAFRLPGTDGGSVQLFAGGNVFGAGIFNLASDSIIAAGGELLISAGGSVNLSGNIVADGAVQGFGGAVEVSAVGNITITGTIDVSGGESGGGSLDLFSEGSMILGEIDMSAGGEFGDAGLGDILSLGNVTMNGILRGNGADNGELCGDAADLDITADGDIFINGTFDMKGRGLDCSGGFLTIDGNFLQIAAQLDLSSSGTEGIGGDIDLSSTASMVIAADLRVDGADGAGDILITSDSDLSLGGNIIANGRGTFGSGASLVELDSIGTLVVSGDIIASGGAQGSGGDVALDGCTVLQTGSSLIDVRAAGGLIGVLGSDSITLQGSFLGEVTSSQAIDIRFGPASNPPNIAAATFNIPPTLTLSELLLPCAVCSSNAECSDGNPCTDDVCIPSTGCTNPANLLPCNDSNACTTNDFCFLTVCVSANPVVCNDGNVCTDDSCNPGLGCQATFNTAPCNDLDTCTENDACAAGSCTGSLIDCEDGNPCTDNSCSAGQCQSVDNTASCTDGDACTTSDQCSGGVCQPGTPPVCTDSDPCTIDSCDSGIGCVNDPIGGCSDGDGDGIIDDEDVCTTLDWSASPQTPPDQNPATMRLNLKNMAKPAGQQGILFKGFFNVAEPRLPIAPELDGLLFALFDDAGVFYEIDIPAGAVGALENCDPRDGWTTVVGSKSRWKYSNKSGALPPGCAPGSARGVTTLQLTDLRSSGKAALQAKVKIKSGDLDRVPSTPLTRIQADLVLGSQPAPGQASAAAIAGQCAEGLIIGSPISGSAPQPFCKAKFRDAALDKVTCKGR